MEAKGTARRATFDDLHAILDINEDVYEGFDYMPALFYIFMQSKQHAIYVYEQEGKLVLLGNYYFHPDTDDMVTAMSGRVRPSFQGQGLGRMDSNYAANRFRKDYPKVTRIISSNRLTPNITTKLNDQYIFVYQWNVQAYKNSGLQRIAPYLRLNQNTTGPRNPISLSYSDAINWLDKNDDLVIFLSRYSANFVPVETTWKPVRVNKTGLRYIFSTSTTMISFGNPGGVDAKQSCLAPNSTVVLPQEDVTHRDRVCGETDKEKSRRKLRENEISALSYSDCLQCKYGLSINVFFYGDSEDIMISHVCSHLRHYVGIVKEDVRIGCCVNFPLTINFNNIEERLKVVLGERINYGHFSDVKEAFLFIAPLPPLPSKI